MRILDGGGGVNGSSCAKRAITVELRSGVAVHGVTLCDSCVPKKKLKNRCTALEGKRVKNLTLMM
jgi:hypothetical protein